MESRLETEVRDVAPALELLKIAKRLEQEDEEGNPAERVDELYLAVEIREFEDEYYAIFQVRVNPIILIENDGYYRSTSFRERNDGWFNSFQLTVDKDSKEVRFGPSGNIMIVPDECRGLGIASYAFGKLITWAQAKYADYKVYHVTVGTADADPDNKDRRNHFYEKHGFIGSFRDPDKKSGIYTCDSVRELIPHAPAENMEVLDVKKVVGKLLKDSQENKQESAALHGSIERQQARIRELLGKQDATNKIIIALAVSIFILGWAFYHFR